MRLAHSPPEADPPGCTEGNHAERGLSIPMVIGLLQLDLQIPDTGSLKGKRQVLLGLKTRLRGRFNVSVAEVDYQDKWQRAALAVAAVGTNQPGVNRALDYVLEEVRRDKDVELLDSKLEFF